MIWLMTGIFLSLKTATNTASIVPSSIDQKTIWKFTERFEIILGKTFKNLSMLK
jgi:hypothetical protein